MTWFHAFASTVVAAVEWIVAILFAILIGLTGMQVFNRFFLNDSVAWAEEVSKILLFYIVFLSGSLAIQRKAFSAFDTYKALPASLHVAALVAMNIIILAFLSAALFFGAKMVSLTMTQITPALEMPQSIVYGAVPLGMAFMIVVTLDRIVAILDGREGA
jgi:TRAP-type C4-dicarboxylate transport system permease small subunit